MDDMDVLDTLGLYVWPISFAESNKNEAMEMVIEIERRESHE